MTKKARRGDIVEVEWVDSEVITLGWASVKDYLAAVKPPQAYRSAGYFLAMTDEHVVLALSMDPSNGSVTQVMSIPKVAVTATQVLGRAHRRTRKALKP